MPWQKNRKMTSGELEFHLPPEVRAKHDEAWMRHRLEKLESRHHGRDH